MKTFLKALSLSIILMISTASANDVVQSELSKDFQDGFRDRSSEIKQMSKNLSDALDTTYNFSVLAEGGMLPPSIKSDFIGGDVSKACTLKPCPIIQQAKPYCHTENVSEPCIPVQWRDYLFAGLPMSEEYNRVSDNTARSSDYKRGQRKADMLLKQNNERLSEVYMGMLLYKALQTFNVVSAPKHVIK